MNRIISACTIIALLAAFASAAEPLQPLPIKLPKAVTVPTPPDLKKKMLEVPTTRPVIQAPAGTVNLALKRPVVASDNEPIIGSLDQITDGQNEGGEGNYVELGPGLQWVQIDLGASHAIYAIAMWHDFGAVRYYRGVIVQISDDPTFKTNVTTLYNNDIEGKAKDAGAGVGKDREYLEQFAGKVIQAAGQRARYVRLYSCGSNDSDNNHYIEVEVYGVK